jgi:hypothetical protein
VRESSAEVFGHFLALGFVGWELGVTGGGSGGVEDDGHVGGPFGFEEVEDDGGEAEES